MDVRLRPVPAMSFDQLRAYTQHRTIQILPGLRKAKHQCCLSMGLEAIQKCKPDSNEVDTNFDEDAAEFDMVARCKPTTSSSFRHPCSFCHHGQAWTSNKAERQEFEQGQGQET